MGLCGPGSKSNRLYLVRLELQRSGILKHLCRPGWRSKWRTSGTFWTITKKFKLFPGGLRPPRPPFKSATVAASARQVRTLERSRPLSRPPGVGSTWSMVWPDNQVIPRPAYRFRNFFLGPISELFSARFPLHFQEFQQIMSTPRTQRNLWHFQEIQQIMSTKTQRNLRAWLGGPGLDLALQAMFWPRPDFQVGPKTSK